MEKKKFIRSINNEILELPEGNSTYMFADDEFYDTEPYSILTSEATRVADSIEKLIDIGDLIITKDKKTIVINEDNINENFDIEKLYFDKYGDFVLVAEDIGKGLELLC